MSATPSSSPAGSPAPECTGRHVHMLDELAEIGMDLARAVRQRALDPSGGANLVECGLVFTRLVRSVRQTVALREKLAADRDRRVRDANAPSLLRHTVLHQQRQDRKDEIRQRVSRGVCRDAVAEGKDWGKERLDLLDYRLDDDDVADWLDDNMPIQEIVARI